MVRGGDGTCGLPEVCGDGILNPANGEQCDDGNLTDGDGCDALCTLEGLPDGSQCETSQVCRSGNCSEGICIAPDPCAAAPADSDGDGVCDALDVCQDGDDTADADLDGVADACDVCPVDNPDDSDGDGFCDSVDFCFGNDAIGDVDGDGVCDDLDLCPFDNPDDSGLDGVCDSLDICPIGDDRLDTDLDGVADACDLCPFDATDSCAVAFCGNTFVDPGEVCDDGNTVDGDGCNSTCTSDESCGNGIVDVFEECDDGNLVDGDGCSAVCTLDGTCGPDAPDDDGDGVCNLLSICPIGDDNLDTDLDGTPDACDICPPFCPAGEVCIPGGGCTALCRVDDDCPGGQVCDVDQFICTVVP